MLKKIFLILFLLITNKVFALQPLSKILSDEEYAKFNDYKSHYKEEYVKNQDWELNDFIGCWRENHKWDGPIELTKDFEFREMYHKSKCEMVEMKDNTLTLKCKGNFSHSKIDPKADFFLRLELDYLHYGMNLNPKDNEIKLVLMFKEANDIKCLDQYDCSYSSNGHYDKSHPNYFPDLSKSRDERIPNGIFKEVGPDEVCPENLPLRDEYEINGKITSIKCYPCDTDYLQLLNYVVDCSVCPNLYKLGENCMYKDFSNMGGFYVNYQNEQAVKLCEESKTHILEHNVDNSEVYCGKRIAGFDCMKASSKLEKLICDNSTLGFYDKKLTKLYNEATGQKELQKQWLKKRNECGLDVKCLKDVYSDRIEELFNYNYINGVYNK